VAVVAVVEVTTTAGDVVVTFGVGDTVRVVWRVEDVVVVVTSTGVGDALGRTRA